VILDELGGVAVAYGGNNGGWVAVVRSFG